MAESGKHQRTGMRLCKIDNLGRLAQLGEHQLDKLGVTGSSPVPPIGKQSQKSW